ncbi:DUF3986 family protein [Geobacillus stearothermophilus]|nr:DUF3986 family protein [Geobacillus stearothermophilus]
MKFDPNQHLHLGYYENNVDLEAVAYKIQCKLAHYFRIPFST